MNGPKMIYEGDDATAARAVADANRPADVRHRDDGMVETWTWRGALRDHDLHQPAQRWEPPQDRVMTVIVCLAVLVAGVSAVALHEPVAAVVAAVAVIALLRLEWNR